MPKDHAGLGDADYEALSEFRYRLRWFTSFSDEAARTAGLTPQQYQALLVIRAHHGSAPIEIGRLAERLLLKPHSAVGLADRLCAVGMVVREHSTTDRRRVGLRLTPHGQEVLAGLAAMHRDQLRRIGPLLRDLLATFGSAETPTAAEERS